MTVFGWCQSGQHNKCKQTFQAFVIVPNRKRGEPSTKIEWLDKWVTCSCLVRRCPCYIKPADRVKTRKPRRKK